MWFIAMSVFSSTWKGKLVGKFCSISVEETAFSLAQGQLCDTSENNSLLGSVKQIFP